jgi:signal transduction histidine kinase
MGTIRSRALILAALTWGAAVAVGVTVTLGLLSASFSRLNGHNATEVTSLARRAAETHADYLAIATHDYAAWDETVALLQGRSPRYFVEAFDSSVAERYELAGAWFFDRDGRLVAEPEAIAGSGPALMPPYLAVPEGTERRWGWFAGADGSPYLFASAGIRSNTGDERTFGTLVFVRPVPGWVMDSAQATVGVPVSFAVDHPSVVLGGRPATASWLGADGRPMFVSVALDDRAEQLALTEVPRAAGFALLALPLTVLLFAAYVDRTLLRRLAALAGQVRALASARTDVHLDADGADDELGEVAASVRELVAQRERSYVALEQSTFSRRRIEQILDAIPLPVVEVDAADAVVLANRAARASGVAVVGGSLEACLRVDPSGDTCWGPGGPQVLVSRGQTEAGAVVVATDVAARVAAERTLLEGLRVAEEGARARSTFLTVISHELRTPLHQIIGYTELMHQEASERGAPWALEDLSRVLDAATQLRAIVDDLLDLSKLESGRMVIQPAPADLDGLVRRLGDGAQRLAEERNNRLRCRWSPMGERLIDEARLRQILDNLISNAARFTEDGDIALEARCEGDVLEVAVIDTGIGMSEAQIARVFEPFVQGEPATTRRKGGTGLGLALVRRLVELMGGRLTCASQLGRGTAVRVTLPCPALALAEA